jgi:glutamate carboxypeptidase
MKKAALAALTATLLVTPAFAAPRDEKLYAAVQSNRAGFLDLLGQLVNIDSGTGDVTGGAKITALLAERLKAIGAQTHYETAEAPGLPDNLVAVFHGTGKGRILVIAHCDTVFGPGTVAQRPFSIDGDRAHGPGVGDEKAGLVNAMTALKILHDIGFKNFATITLLVETSEERGSTGTNKLIRALSAQHDVEFNMEPGDAPDVLTVWRKGSTVVTIHVTGRAAHAGVAPQDGRNAAIGLIHQLDRIAGIVPISGDGPTLNLTMLNAGTRSNIIPDNAEAQLSFRFRQPQQRGEVIAKLNAAMEPTLDTQVSVKAETGYPPLIETPEVDALADRAGKIYAELGKTIGRSGNGGASESALAQSVGTPALDGLGLVGGDFHTDHEWIDLTSLEPRLYLITRLLIDTGANPPAKP